MTHIDSAVEKIYEAFDCTGVHDDYHRRHDSQSLNVLTVHSPDEAREVVAGFKEHITGKRVVEIGAGVGFLSIELARHAAQVTAIEVDPAWSWVFTKYLYANKPANLTWIFGNADLVAPWLRADVVVLRTRSGARRLVSIAEVIAPTIVLSACAEPLIAERGSEILREMAEYIERRVVELTREVVELFNTFEKV